MSEPNSESPEPTTAAQSEHPAQPLPPPRALTIHDLRPDNDNANKGSERGTGLLEDVLRRRGFARSIVVDRDNRVIAGNQALQAAVNAGIVRLRVVETDGNEVIAVRRKDILLDSTAGRELAIADNAVALRSINLDGEVIARQAKEYDLELEAVGISPEELKRLLAKATADDDEGCQGGGEEQDAPVMGVLVKCQDKAERTRVLRKLRSDGYDCEVASTGK